MKLFLDESARARFITRLLVLAGETDFLVQWLEKDPAGLSRALEQPRAAEGRRLLDSLGGIPFSMEEVATAAGCFPHTVRAAVLGLVTGMPSDLGDAYADAVAAPEGRTLPEEPPDESGVVRIGTEDDASVGNEELEWLLEQLEQTARREEALAEDLQRERERRMAATRRWKDERRQWRELTLWCLRRLKEVQPDRSRWFDPPPEVAALFAKLLPTSGPKKPAMRLQAAEPAAAAPEEPSQTGTRRKPSADIVELRSTPY